MIFDCPRCEAENAIPVADIPPEGKVAICVACKQPFRVLPPDPDDLDGFEPEETQGSEAGEPTMVGPSALAFDEFSQDDKTAGLFAPPPRQESAVPPLIAKNTADLPPEVLGGKAAGSQASDGVVGTEDTLMPAEGRALGRRLRGRPPEDRTPPSGVPVVGASPAPPPPTNQAAMPTLPPDGPPGPAAAVVPPSRPKIPLAAKVGAAVFPIALFAAFLMRPGSSATSTPIALPIAPQVDTASAVASAAPASPPSIAPQQRTGVSPLTRDVRAEPGFQYVVVEDAIVRSSAGATSPAVGRAREGTLVRAFERVGDATVVMLGETGPAGFVAATSLSARMPVRALAAKAEFEGCGERATCADVPDAQAASCAASCDEEMPADPGTDTAEILRKRCHEACELARASCAKACGVKAAAPVASVAPASPTPTANPSPPPAIPSVAASPTPTKAPVAPRPIKDPKPKDFKKPRQVY